ncbi:MULTISPECIES: DUF1491 family protein [unclassified Sphingomonas]|uniref:DUF1491 family protein n=1 Tax=unclassified Sphingomonas TaxID=196159 RepID=UPI0006FCAD87|nr:MULTISPECIES: DUF1491 family protein [unclassified Sphingomonas]KQM62031.1 hypothetical protein ASE65_03115 [Sphingomonas sp. Leaf16]KQN13431.1 hypothetical protein ASE81_03185 [Sphingomonas sp. Leaf29]KQN23333.1 hypothetical protein ASE83_02225 [Sphingomonas sp. Leaf32]
MSDWPTALRVNAFTRAVEAAGGSAMVLARGDRDSGIVLLLAIDRNGNARLLERERDLDGRSRIVRRKPDLAVEADLTAYWCERRERDPDLWVVEAIVATAEPLAAETLWAD